MSKAWLLLTLLLVASLLLAACGGGKSQADIKNLTTFIAASIGGPETLDPAAAYDSASGEVLQMVYEPLIFFEGESTTEFRNVLADDWEVSADGMTYSFHIREGVTFHNGNDLTPEDVEYTFERSLVQDYVGAPTWMIYEPLLGIGTSSHLDDGSLRPLEDLTSVVEVVDGGWVEFYLVAPYEPFMQILANWWGGIVDMEWCIDNGDWDGTQESYEALNNPESNAWPLDRITNGTGPFELEYWDQAVEVSLLRNDDYWGDAVPFERLIIKEVEEWTTRKLMLENGDCDWAYVPTINYGEMEGAEGITAYEELPLVNCEGFFFNFAISEESAFIGSGQLDGDGIPTDFFADVDVRKGFTYCFDWEAYIEDAMDGYGIQPASCVVQGLSYYNPNLDHLLYSYDPVQAEEHFRAAFDGEVWENGFTLTLAYNSGNDTRKVACEILAENVNAINPKFNVTASPQEWTSYGAQMYARILPCFQVGWLPDFMDAHNFMATWMHEGGYWAYFQSYNNPEATALVEEGIASTDPDERQAIYDELAEIHYEDCPGILLVQPIGNRYFKDWVQGYYFNPAHAANYGWVPDLTKEY